MVAPERAAAFAGRRCLVTGGLGFIGSSVTIALAEAGAHVRVIDSLDERHGGDLRNLEGVDAEVIVADIASPEAVPLLDGADIVFNLAGQVSHTDSMRDPMADLEANTRSQLAFLEAVRRSGSRPVIVYSSTRQVYGRPRYLPMDEAHPVDPVDINGANKLAAEHYHLLHHRVHGIPASVIRLSNVYGPRQRQAGEHQGFLPVFTARALAGETIEVFGDGDLRRDCLFVDDAVAALLAAADEPAALGEVINVGHDADHTLREVAELMVATAGSGSVRTVEWPSEHRQIAIGSCRLDCTKAAAILGWRPTVGLEEGVQRTLAHHRAPVR